MALPELTVDTEPGFADLTFAVSIARSDPVRHYIGTAQHGGVEVALSAELHGPWIAGRLDHDVNLVVYRGRVDLIRTDDRSDNFVRVMDGLYGTGFGALKMTNRIALLAVSLAGDPAHPELGLVKLKLFHGDEKSDGYAEAYFNLDVGGLKMQLREKDPKYRVAMVRALAAL
ncbi:MAG: hypothetical protein SGI86_08050 [Deltaproteobacteria bacterium]|nr:hypothetical protein [Deltaproteobacteria bacterium]